MLISVQWLAAAMLLCLAAFHLAGRIAQDSHERACMKLEFARDQTVNRCLGEWEW